MKRLTLDQFLDKLTPQARARIQAQLEPQLASRQPQATTTPASPDPKMPKRKPKGPNLTEREYAMAYLAGKDARYEALTIHMANGHAYTPDWTVFVNGLPTEIHEVKGSYRHHSLQRAKLAFDQARTEWPGLAAYWAVKERHGWNLTRLQ